MSRRAKYSGQRTGRRQDERKLTSLEGGDGRSDGERDLLCAVDLSVGGLEEGGEERGSLGCRHSVRFKDTVEGIDYQVKRGGREGEGSWRVSLTISGPFWPRLRVRHVLM